MLLRPWLFALWAAGLQAIAAPVLPETHSIVVECSDSLAIEVVPPRLITLAFRITNRTDHDQAVWDEIRLPEGWQPIAHTAGFSLPPHASDLRLWCLSIPAAAAPGNISLSYAVRSAMDSSVLGRAEAGVHLSGYVKLEAFTDPVPERILSGEEYHTQIRIANRGNAPCRVALDPSLSSACRIVLSLTHFIIEPNGSVTVAATVLSHRDYATATKHRLAVNVTVPEDPCAGLQVLAPAPVEIVPRAAPAGDLYHRVPSHFATRVIGEGDHSAMQLEYAGQGSVDPGGRYTIDYLIRGPRDLERNSFGLRDEYFLRLKSGRGEVRAGDQLFTLSPLTERSRLGRGVSATYRVGRFQTGGFALKARGKYPDLEEQAGFAGLNLGRAIVRINALRKQTATEDRMLVGASSDFSLLPRTHLNMEYAMGEGSVSGEARPWAAAGRFDGNWKPLRLTLEKTYAAPDFPGYLRSHDQNSAVLYLPLFKHLRWQTFYRTLDLNLDHDPELSSASCERQWQTRLSYMLPWNFTGDIDGDDLRRWDAMNPSHYGSREQSLTFGMRKSLHFFSADGSVRYGRWNNLQQGGSSKLERYTLGLRYSPSPRHSYSTSFQTGYYGSSSGVRRNQIVRLGAHYKIMRRLSVGVNVQRSDIRSDFAFDNNQFDVDARWMLSWRHVLTLRYRRLDYEQDYLPTGSSLLLGYEVPVGMPISRQTEIGRLMGRIFDGEDSQRRGIGGVLVTLNTFSARSDKDGNFSFPSLQPGQYYLQIDREAIGFDHIPVSRTPVSVIVRGGKTEAVQIGITRSATLEGEVAVFGLAEQESDHGLLTESPPDSSTEPSAAREMIRLNGLAGVDMELQSLREVIRITTDRSGRFSFDELRPGMWTLRISPAVFPPFHQVETDSISIVLAPGDHQDLQVRVLPRVRPVIVVDEGPVPVVKRDRRR